MRLVLGLGLTIALTLVMADLLVAMLTPALPLLIVLVFVLGTFRLLLRAR